ncbi:MAG: MATE family efflux transporter [Clostridia bacterium]|nr:MATE family efflux transporter [Clostridia bacterium]
MATLTADSKRRLFAETPIPKALLTLAIPTVISQLINLIYNMVDAFFIGRTGNAYMTAATTITLTLVLMNVAFGNLFGIGGGSLITRLMGRRQEEEARRVSAFSFWGAVGVAVCYSAVIAICLDPLLRFLGASDDTIGFAREYTIFVLIIGTLPALLSAVLAHLLRNVGHARQASLGLSGGGVLNMLLDPLFMFVLLPDGCAVIGAALATLLSNTAACIYLLIAFRRAADSAPLSLRFSDARAIRRESIGELLSVGVPSAILTGLFDLANICVNMIASAHNDLVLAGMGIVMKVERIPNAINIGVCQGMLPIVAFNYAAGNRERMQSAIRTARIWGLGISFASIILLELLAKPATGVFLSTSAGDAAAAARTVAYAAVFLRIRCLASPVQFINYHSSYCMQAMGNGRGTMLHAVLRELAFYIPLMYVLDYFFGENGLAAALVVGEALGAVAALVILQRGLRRREVK